MYFLSLLTLILLPFGELLRFEVMSGIRFRVLDALVLALILLITFKKTQRHESITKPVTLFGAVLALSLLANIPSPLSSLMYLLRTLMYLYLLTHQFLKGQSRAHIINLKRVLYVSFALLPLAGLTQYFLYPNLRNLYYMGYDPHLSRLFGSLLDPNLIGILFVWMFFYLFSQKKHLYTVALLILSLISLLFTYSRVSMISFVAGMILQNSSLKIKKHTIFIGIFIFAAVVLFALPRYFGEGTNIWRSNSIFAKEKSLNQAIALFQKNPFTGIGFNNISLYKEKSTYTDNSLFGIDNSLLTVFVTAGIMGVLAYFFLFYSLFISSRGFVRLLVVTYFIHALSTNSFFTPTVFVYFVFLRELSINSENKKSTLHTSR